jgi:hypothetical protein
MDSDPSDLFPRMPKAVFDAWIRPCIADYGWPFSYSNLLIQDERWQKFFDDKSLSYWRSLYWSFSSLKISNNVLDSTTRLRIGWVIGANVRGLKTPTTNLKDTSERFRACTEFIKKNGSLPSAIIGVPTPRGFRVVDGHHRLAALFHLKMAEGKEVPAWMGVKNPGPKK